MANFWDLPYNGEQTKTAIFDEYRRRLDQLAEAAKDLWLEAWMAHDFLGPLSRRLGFDEKGLFTSGSTTVAGTSAVHRYEPATSGVQAIFNAMNLAYYKRGLENTKFIQGSATVFKQNLDRLVATLTPILGGHPITIYATFMQRKGETIQAMSATKAQRIAECKAWLDGALAAIGESDTRPTRGEAKAGARAITSKLAVGLTKFGPVFGSIKPGQVIKPGSPLEATGGKPRPVGSDVNDYLPGGKYAGAVGQGATPGWLLPLGIAAAAAAVLLFMSGDKPAAA